MDDKDLRIQELKEENEKLKKQIEELVENELDPIELCKVAIALDRLKEYEERGILLPCKVGDTVYELQKIRQRIQPLEIISIHIGRMGELYFYWELKDGIGVYHNVKGFGASQLGKDVFLTEQEAQAALEKMKGE